MPTTITCPECRQGLKLARIPPEGKRVVCPKCSHRFAPKVETAADTVADVPLPAAAAVTPPPVSPAYGPVLKGVVGFAMFALFVTVGYFFLPKGEPKSAPPTTAEVIPAPVAAVEKPKDKEPAQDKQLAEVTRLMIAGNAALAEQRYEDAIKCYGEALTLAPENLDAAKGLNAAKTALAATTKDKQDGEKAKTDLARLLDEAKQAVADKKYAQAVRTYEAALALAPGDVIATRGLEEAKLALAADLDEKKKLADYQKYMDAGRAAVVAQRYTDAIREYTAALAVLPGDTAALDGRRMAEKRISDEMGDGKKREAYLQAMKAGGDAAKAKKYDDAMQSFEAALKIMPGDKDAQQALDLAKKAQAEAMTAFNGLMAQADNATRLQRYEEAARLYAEANRLNPTSPNALAGLENAQRMMGSIQAGQTAYLRFMNTGALAMQSRRYADAARNYSEALRIAPNDRDALLGLREAERKMEREAANRGLYNDAIQKAVNAYKQAKYTEAAKFYQEALVLIPDDPTALNGVRQSRYQQAMSDADSDMRAKKYTDAVRDYETALREIPGDPTAARGWQQAKAAAQKK